MSVSSVLKPRLLVLELWGLGDLAIGIPFLKAATDRFEVTLIAKPYAQDLAAAFFPLVRVYSFVAPWTAFKRKYRLLNWPWRELFLLRRLRGEAFELGVSARWDPRDHVLLRGLGCGRRMGFARLGSQILLTDRLPRPAMYAHRYESWRVLGEALGLSMPGREHVGGHNKKAGHVVLVHSGAGQRVRVWPLERYRNLANKIRQQGYEVQVVCDPDQEAWWRSVGQANLTAPRSVAELIAMLNKAGAFIGNDSGPGHLAALSGVPTFTLFGPQLSEWFAPLHPDAEWMNGSPCPYKPCFDSCRFSAPECLIGLNEDSVWAKVSPFLAKHKAR